MLNPTETIKLGPVCTSQGTQFSLYSENATRVEICIFDSVEAEQETYCLPLKKSSNHIWHVLIKNAGPGTLYGYRVFGPFNPGQGHWFNPSKLLIDPYAPLLGRSLKWDDKLFSLSKGGMSSIHDPDFRDSASCAPLGQVVESSFDWGKDSSPKIPWDETIIYETHVKGISQLHPKVPEKIRGTFLGLSSSPIVDHLLSLGITSVELLPIHQAVTEKNLHQNNLVNYWGYNSLLFFAPDKRFATVNGDPIREFKEMVKVLHSAGIEVILDVVFNHTPEGNESGPTLSLKGIDNLTYYKLDEKNSYTYLNYTGCGNTINMNHPKVRQLILDSLRYWVQEMHVDGFRFDLATVLGRGKTHFDGNAEIFKEIRNDPILTHTKLIAEPWDLGPEGYQVSGFPKEWSEWNDQYRQTIRRFWRGDPGHIGLFARRFSGSSDIYSPKNRLPQASLNYITCHDGFTLEDLVSYKDKHNEPNLENNRDGTTNNDSENYGAEGPTNDSDIGSLRNRQKKNLLATLLTSLGVPMILGGDELSRTQKGNNNTYCQDNESNWYHWNLNQEQEEFLNFFKKAIQLKKKSPSLRRAQFFDENISKDEQDVLWLNPEGEEMDETLWHDETLKSITIVIPTYALSINPENPNSSIKNSLAILINAESKNQLFQFPSFFLPIQHWDVILNTDSANAEKSNSITHKNNGILLKPKSLVILRLK